MTNSANDDIISVWVWFHDIDHNEAANQIEKLTGLSINDIDKITQPQANVDLSDTFYQLMNNNSISKKEASTLKQKAQLLVSESKAKNEKLNKIISEYKQTRINVLSSMYLDNNQSILKKLQIPSESISFCSNLTPSAVLTISKDEIIKLESSNEVTQILLYDNNDINDYGDDNTYLRNKVSDVALASTHADITMNTYGYTGEDINILMVAGNGYADNNPEYNNPDLIENVINHHTYPVTDTEHLPENIFGHVVHCVIVLKEYAPDAHVYVVPTMNFSDFEWAIENLNIDIINFSAGLGYPLDYSSSASAKWYDVLTSLYSLPLIASAGNGANMGYDFPYVYSPANSYNSIAVSAYIPSTVCDDDIMRPYRYNPIENSNVPRYKPDVVVPANDTSSAAPALSGMLAWVIESNPDLRLHPQELKAIVLASCHRKVRPAEGTNDIQESIYDELTEKQGAGAIDAFRILYTAVHGGYGRISLGANDITSQANLSYQHAHALHNGTIDYHDRLNVSLAWYINGVSLSSSPSSHQHSILSHIQDINLQVLDGSNTIATSTVTNSNKQMAYISEAESNHTYRINLTNVTATSDREAVEVGYAWSEKGREEITGLNLQGTVAVNSTLTASALFAHTSGLSHNEVTFQWSRSNDGNNWETILNDGASYTLTNDDFHKYVKCEVIPNELSLLTPQTWSAVTPTKVVIYGDANLDGAVNSADVLYIQIMIANHFIDATSEMLVASDLDLNGIVDIVDTAILQRYLEGVISELPWQP